MPDDVMVMVLVGGAFGRCVSLEGEALLQGISAFKEAAPEKPLAPPTTLAHSEQGLAKNQEKVLNRPCWCLDLGLLSFQDWKH